MALQLSLGESEDKPHGALIAAATVDERMPRARHGADSLSITLHHPDSQLPILPMEKL